jgi:hypothetical protein
MIGGEPRVLLDGLAIGESPRWHDGRLWFSNSEGRLRRDATDSRCGRHGVVSVGRADRRGQLLVN